jgi:uncharacterized protein (TIGR02246 family)
MGVASPEAVAQAFAAAINSGDLQGALELWLDDAVFVPADGVPLQGKDALHGVLGALVENGARMRIEMEGCHVAGPAAVGYGTLSFTTPSDENGSSTRFTAVYARDPDGSWRIAIDAPWGLPLGQPNVNA